MEPLNLRDLAWAVSTLLEFALLVLLYRRKLYRSHLAFSSYVLVAFVQSILMAWAGKHWGERSIQYFDFAWGTQAVVLCARWIAVMEIAKRVLSGYTGVWKLASTILFVLCLTILVYAVATVPRHWDLMVLNADLAVELSVAGFVVGMLLFARYYRLRMTNLETQLTIGFGLYSCSWVISSSAFQVLHHLSATWWNFFQILSFFATLVLWVNAVRQPVEVPSRKPIAVPLDQFGELSLEADTRLRQLNDRLNHLLRSKGSRP
jgi:hypothetical protein